MSCNFTRAEVRVGMSVSPHQAGVIVQWFLVAWKLQFVREYRSCLIWTNRILRRPSFVFTMRYPEGQLRQQGPGCILQMWSLLQLKFCGLQWIQGDKTSLVGDCLAYRCAESYENIFKGGLKWIQCSWSWSHLELKEDWEQASPWWAAVAERRRNPSFTGL